MAWYYTFEAKEIQRFILQSDKLRDMVGGSEMVNQLCEGFLNDVLKAVGVVEPAQAIIASAAGWARIRFEDGAQAKEFYDAWPLLTARFAPGIQVIQHLGEITGTLPEAMNAGFEALRGQRNLNRAVLPEIGPLVERAPRTGGAAADSCSERNAKVLIDRATMRKRNHANNSSLISKISREFPTEAWPYELDDIVAGKSPYVAVVHADGNDLGATLMRIKEFLMEHPDQADKIYKGFSAAIEETTVEAVKKAAEETIFADFRAVLAGNPKAKLPVRPIVLGGDDLTIIIRADLAIDFTARFLEAFEQGSKQILDKHLGGFSIKNRPAHLTACAGISFVKKAYPFAAAYRMAESLCGHSKTAAKSVRASGECVPSSLTFHRISTSMAGEFGEVKRQELTGRGTVERLNPEKGTERTPVKFWLGPYAVGANGASLPALASLQQLSKTMSELPQGTIRTLISTMHTDPQNAEKEFNRILQVADSDKATAMKKALTDLTGVDGLPLWDGRCNTPLADAHTVRELTKGGADVRQ